MQEVPLETGKAKLDGSAGQDTKKGVAVRMWFSYGALLLVTSAVVLLLLTWLWNTTLPDIFDLPQVRMWQMLRLLLILALLVLVALVAAWMWAQAIGLAL